MAMRQYWRVPESMIEEVSAENNQHLARPATCGRIGDAKATRVVIFIWTVPLM
jgi:hypothetical protein